MVELIKTPNQSLRLRMTLVATAGGLAHIFLLWVCLQLGFFRGGTGVFLALAGIDVAGRLTFLVLIMTGANLRFKEPSLTLPQIVWATLCVIAAVNFVEQGRLVFLMFFLQVMFFAAFRLMLRGFLYITVLAALGYGLVILNLAVRHPESIHVRIELFQWFGFVLVMLSLSLIGNMLNAFIQGYRRQNIELTAAMKRIEELAVTDELTGLYNRRYILDIINDQRSRVQRNERTFSVCYLDLDHFKRINDTYGHQAGDVVLKRVSEGIGASVREVDWVSRFGGEEFVVVLSGSDLESARQVADRCRRRIKEISFDDVAPDLWVTVSIGVAQYQRGETIDNLLSRADDALYQAKEQGRNCTVCETALLQAALN